MKRKDLYSVSLETNCSGGGVLKETFDHLPTVESLRASWKLACDVVDQAVADHTPSDDSAEDEIFDERINKWREELAALDELISAIKPGGMAEACDAGHHTIFVAGCRVGHIDIEKSTYLSQENDLVKQTVVATVEHRGARSQFTEQCENQPASLGKILIK